ncbi:MAG: hypothetical protein DRO94_00215 [Candidatus Altiarchaeales archaeon]|nr:MAG: hypothetical protein DRO95_00420 [Candidatus Altiarchaeales archaeon]RLI95541.1 MAG: hypothetical protein DRO94_00215 [Candidatus Altiarchaeales archaeon]
MELNSFMENESILMIIWTFDRMNSGAYTPWINSGLIQDRMVNKSHRTEYWKTTRTYGRVEI